jgi:glucose-6-phosphate 1-dehydrogenase
MVETPNPQVDVAPVAPPATLFLFGARGDLVKRLLVPSLYNLMKSGLVGDDLHIVGVDHNEMTDDSYRETLGEFIKSHADKSAEGSTSLDPQMWESLAGRISYLQGDFMADETYAQIGQRIEQGSSKNCVFYLATAPRFFAEVVDRLAGAKLLQETEDQFRRVVIEKPFGSDLASAKALNARILNAMDEHQIYRIDHYLGKETVQNILVSRFANGIFEAFWNNHYVDHVQITAAETVGVEQRGNFYETIGALRDMVPNHLFQLLAMVAMEPPSAFDADSVRTEKAKVVGAIRPVSAQEAITNSVRGQYSSGFRDGQKLAGYRDEPRVAPDSNTETYVALKLWVDNWRWAGVPFYLRTGKRLKARETQIAICFKPAPFSPFRDTEIDRLRPNYLIIQIQPDEGMWIDFHAKRPGAMMRIDNVQMGFAYADYFTMLPTTGYETLLYDCLTGDQTLFQRADNIENGWRAVQPFLDAWHQRPSVEFYAAGTDGPAGADALLARDGRAWRSLDD